MQDPPPGRGRDTASHPGTRRLARRLWSHIGMVTGGILAAIAFAATLFLAAIGFTPALFLLVFVVAGVVLIVLGGRIRGS